MKIFKPLQIFVVLFTLSTLEAQILEVNQLFNKKLVKVKQEQIGTIKSFYGSIVIDESKVVDVVNRYDGFITKLHADKNLMHIKKAEPLFRIYSDKVQAIQQELNITKSINKNLYQSALDKLHALGIDALEIKKMKNSKKLFKDIAVNAPFDALVLSKKINQGSFAPKGKQLMQLANINQLWFIAKVYQKDLPFIQKGMRAKVFVDGFNQSFKTSVDYIYPMVTPSQKTVDVRFVLDNKALKLYPNMFAKVQIQNSQRSMLTLPKTAVLNKGGKYFVFKPVSNEEFEPIAIEAKRISSSKYEIREGLSAGDEVVNNALFLLDSDALTNGLYDSDEDDDW